MYKRFAVAADAVLMLGRLYIVLVKQIYHFVILRR